MKIVQSWESLSSCHTSVKLMSHLSTAMCMAVCTHANTSVMPRQQQHQKKDRTCVCMFVCVCVFIIGKFFFLTWGLRKPFHFSANYFVPFLPHPYIPPFLSLQPPAQWCSQTAEMEMEHFQLQRDKTMSRCVWLSKCNIHSSRCACTFLC